MNDRIHPSLLLLCCSVVTPILSGQGPAIVSANSEASVTRTSVASTGVAKPIERTALAAAVDRVAWGSSAGEFGLSTVAGASILSTQIVPDVHRWVGTPSEDYASSRGAHCAGIRILEAADKVVVALRDGTVRVLRLSTGATLVERRLAQTAAALDASATLNRVVVGSDQGQVSEYDLATLAILRTFRAADGQGEVGLARYIRGGSELLTSLRDYDPAEDFLYGGSVRDAGLVSWSTSTGARVHSYVTPPNGACALDNPVTAGLSGAGFESGLGLGYDAGNAPVTTRFAATQDFVGLTAGSREILVTVVADSLLVYEAATQGPLLDADLGTAWPGSLSTDGGSRVCIGRPDGSFEVLTIRLGAGGILALPYSSSVAQFPSTHLDSTHALLGHRAPLREIVVRPGNTGFVSRDAQGAIIGWWDDPISGQGGVPFAFPVPAMSESRSAMTFNAAGTKLYVIGSDHQIYRMDLLNGGLVDTLAVTFGNADIVAVLPVDNGRILVATDDGSVRGVVEATGVVEQVVIPASSTPGVMPFTMLGALPDGRVILCPEIVLPATLQSPHAFHLRDAAAPWIPRTGFMPLYVDRGRVLIMNQGQSVLITDRGADGTALHFDASDPTMIAETSRTWGFLAGQGACPLGPTEALAFTTREIRYLDVSPTTTTTTQVHTASFSLGRTTAVAGGGNGVVYVGLRSGGILRLVATPQ